MNKRHYCANCLYPQSVCICEHVKTIHTPIKILILQHPTEVKQAKNTAKLLALSIENLEIFVGENERDFEEVKEQILASPQQHGIFYPNDLSQPIEESLPTEKHHFHSLIFIDSTWRKAFKIWQLNPWLHQLPSFHFQTPPASRYQIRKTSVANGLSTLEAAAYALNTMYDIDCCDLYTLFSAMQKSQLQHRPTP